MDNKRRWRKGIAVLIILLALCLHELKGYLLTGDAENIAMQLIFIGICAAMAAGAARRINGKSKQP